MIKIALTKAPTSLLECAVYISARKKLIHAMSLDIDRPINRAVVVGCAISATRNYLKLHMSRTLKVLEYSWATLMPKRGSCGSVLPGCRLSKQHPSINSLAVHGCTSRACRDARCTTFGSPVCRRPLLLSRCPTSRDFVPWRFLDAGQLSARVFHCYRRPKNSTFPDLSATRPEGVG